MPEVGINTPAERAKGISINMHPRLNGDHILTPDDILEGDGNLNTNDDGGARGYQFLTVENPIGWNVYVGTDPGATTKQNSAILPASRSSWVGNQPVINGSPAPDASTPGLAQIPKPATPQIKTIATSSGGYGVTTATRPNWYAYSLSPDGVYHTPLSPDVSFTNGQGQSLTVTLPTDAPKGIRYIGLWLPEPGTSTAAGPGPMRLQRLIDLQVYSALTYDLTGPFRFGREAPITNETEIPITATPQGYLVGGGTLQPGFYFFAVTFTNERGESLPWDRQSSGPAPYFFPNQHLNLYRPTAPPGATGWHLYITKIETEAQGGKNVTGRAYYRYTREGLDYPFPISRTYVPVYGTVTENVDPSGWDIGAHALPTQNTTGIAAPSSAPPAPVATGASFPPPDTYYVRVTKELADGSESLPSDAASVSLDDSHLMRVIQPPAVNIIINGEFLEVDSSGLPLDHTFVTTGGAARMEAGAVVLETSASTSGTTPSMISDPVRVNPLQASYIDASFSVENPPAGTYAGSVELVLRELNASGTPTDTVLYTATAPGTFEAHQTIAPSGSGGIAFHSGTVTTQLLWRFTGTPTTKNARLRIVRHRQKGYGQPDRVLPPAVYELPAISTTWPPSLPPPSSPTPPGAGTPPPPGGGGHITPPYTPPSLPEPSAALTLAPLGAPDRPSSAGTVLESVDFESGLPAGWTQSRVPTDGTTTLAANATAALVGSQGLQVKDTGTATPATVVLYKTFAAAGRHDMGLHAKMRTPVIPVVGSVQFNSLDRPSDGRPFAWWQISSVVEKDSLLIYGSPTDPGSVGVVLDGVTTSIAVVATKEVATLNLTSGNTAPGTVTITLDGHANAVIAGGTQEVVNLNISQGAITSGYIYITLDNVQTWIYVLAGDNPTVVASRIRNGTFAGWTTSGYSTLVTFTANLGGPRSAPGWTTVPTNVNGTLTRPVLGAGESAAALGDRIRSFSFSGWTTSGVGAQVIFTAVAAGNKVDATYSPGSAGATGSIGTTTQGTADTPAQLASRIAAASFTGWTAAVNGSNTAQVDFTATTSGVRQDIAFNAGGTGTLATPFVTQQGASADLTACVRDTAGSVLTRRVITGLTTTQVFNVEVAVSGAGTDKAIVSFWASLGSNTKQLVGRFESVDLTGYPAGRVSLGAISESASSVTWEQYIDDVRVTNRGDLYYHDHDPVGGLINQAYHFGPETQPLRQDLFLQERRDPLVPARQYTRGIWVRYANVSTTTPTRLTLTAYSPEGDVVVVGNLVNMSGGTVGWQEYTLPFTAPSLVGGAVDCSEIRLGTADIGVGEIVVQEDAMSEGATVKRTGLYATSGSYQATLDISTPDQYIPVSWGRERTLFESSLDIPVGTSLTDLYRSRQSPSDLPSTLVSDPSLVPQLPILEAQYSATSDGTITPVIHSGYPRALYDLKLGPKTLNTFLKSDRTEFSGGAVFKELQEISAAPTVGVVTLPTGRLYRQRIFDPVTVMPASTLLVFSAEARRYIEDRWGTEYFAVEAFGDVLTIKLSAPPVFKSISPRAVRGEQINAVFEATLPPSEVIKVDT